MPDAKLIYLVREPIERTISDYAHHVALGLEQRSLDEALKDLTDPENYCVTTSRYPLQVGRYLEHFPASSLLVLDQSDLRDRREETIREVFSFVGVDATFRSPEFEESPPETRRHLKHGSVGWRLRESPLGAWFRHLPLQPRLRLARMARHVLPTEERPTLDPTLEAELAHFLIPEVEQLRLISGKPLKGLPATVKSPAS